jgi:Ca2+-binding RTX toxin-like protein
MSSANSGQPNLSSLSAMIATQRNVIQDELIKIDQQISAFLAALKADPTLRKIGGALAGLSQSGVPDLFKNSSLLQIFGGYVVVEATATGNSAALKADLERLGLVNGTAFGRQVSGLLPISAINQAAQLSSLSFINPVYRPITNVGATTSQADVSMRADIARTNFGVNGSGITVGVLSDSYNNLGGAASDVNSRDLPGIGNPNNSNVVQVLSDLGSGGSDEGRAMVQLVHDVAPGASLSFHTAFLGQADFAQGIIDLANAGADVIVDDVIYFAEPMFQDGIIAQAVDQVVARGIPYFSSAGNNGRRSYEAGFQATGQSFDGGELHDFDPGAAVDTGQSVTIGAGGQLLLSFQWSNPFRSVSGGTGAQTDMDIYLVDNAGNILAAAASNNIGNDPVEILNWVNNSGSAVQANLVITRFAGTAPAKLKYVSFSSRLTLNEFNTNSSTVYGHAGAAGAAAVGAAYYRETPAFGVNPPRIESFSSAGPTEILFTTTGAATSQRRNRPNIVAPDGTNTTFFGQDSDSDGFPNFFGTSAAAPHAAAVAALMLSAAQTSSPNAIYQALQNTAIDMDDPATSGPDTGYDFGTGFGLIQADAALQALIGTPNPVPTVNGKPATIYVNASNRIVGGPNNNQNYGGFLTGTSGDDVISATEGNDIINGAGGNDTIGAKGGINWITVTQGNNYIEAGSGNDTISIGSGNDEVKAGDGANYIYTNALSTDGTNRITSGSGNDNISMRTGNNIINSGDGNDFVGIGAGQDIVNAGGGSDYIYSIGILDTVAGDVNTIDAGEGTNTISLYGGTNDIVTGSGDDTITVGNGNDRINAGTGNNTVTGGAGADRFVLVQGAGAITIQDFKVSENDRLSGFSFSQVSITQGTGFDFNNTLITLVGGDLLAKLSGVQANTITASSFV